MNNYVKKCIKILEKVGRQKGYSDVTPFAKEVYLTIQKQNEAMKQATCYHTFKKYKSEYSAYDHSNSKQEIEVCIYCKKIKDRYDS